MKVYYRRDHKKLMKECTALTIVGDRVEVMPKELDGFNFPLATICKVDDLLYVMEDEE